MPCLYGNRNFDNTTRLFAIYYSFKLTELCVIRLCEQKVLETE